MRPSTRRTIIAAATKTDRRPIPEWLHDNWILPAAYAQPGRFDVVTSRHMIAPFAAIQDSSVREVTVMAAVQTGKTLTVEGAICWAACNSPGPIMWTHQTEEKAREFCHERFMEGLKNIKQIRDMLPRERHAVTATEIYFGPFFLGVNGANLSSLQSKSIRWKFNSEVWLWKQGLLEHARARVTAFERAGNSKVVNESQGSTDGDDFHEAYKSGHQAEWSIKCFGCGKQSPLVFSGPRHDNPAAKANVVWADDARRGDGTWNVARACETAHWECPHCGEHHDDSSRTRARWNAEGEYLVRRTDAPAHIKSYRWEALVARPMAELVSQFLEARRQQKQGVMQAMIDFTRQRRALPWKEDDMMERVMMKGSGYLLNSPTIADKIDGEADRFLTIDRQRDIFYCVIGAWRADGSSRRLYHSLINTTGQLREVQQKFNVADNRVFEDSGYFADAVYQDCADYGWTALRGSGDNYFSVEKNKVKYKRMWSDVKLIQKNNKLIPLIDWASDPVKDILHNLRIGKGAKWETADDQGSEYERQMNGERKKMFENKKTKKQEWRWQRTHDNHYWDCEAMQVVAALILGILASPEPPKDESVYAVHTSNENERKP